MTMLKGKKVLVTGADGFIGSHLVERLVREGCRVTALAYYNSFNHWGWLEEISSRDAVTIKSGDVRDAQFCRELTQEQEIVFHLAALIGIPYSYSAPASYLQTNVLGTQHMLDAARAAGSERIIVTSTSEVYGTAKYAPIDENHPLQPQSPYSASKIGADALAQSYHLSFDLPVTVARPFNTYGPRQSARAVIPTMIAQLLSGKSSVRLGDVETKRDFTFVEDTCEGFVRLASSEETIGETCNIGMNQEGSIRDVFNLLKEIIGSTASYEVDDQRLRPRNSEVHRLLCDNTKIKRLTGFEPAHDLKSGLKKTVEWFRRPENLSRFKGDLYNV